MAQSDQNNAKIISRHERFFHTQNDFLEKLRKNSDIFFVLKTALLPDFFEK